MVQFINFDVPSMYHLLLSSFSSFVSTFIFFSSEKYSKETVDF